MKRRPQIVLGLTVITGILSVVANIRATEPAKGEIVDPPFQTRNSLSLSAVAESSACGDTSASEVNRQLANPVSGICSISNQFNNFELNSRS